MMGQDEAGGNGRHRGWLWMVYNGRPGMEGRLAEMGDFVRAAVEGYAARMGQACSLIFCHKADWGEVAAAAPGVRVEARHVSRPGYLMLGEEE